MSEFVQYVLFGVLLHEVAHCIDGRYVETLQSGILTEYVEPVQAFDRSLAELRPLTLRKVRRPLPNSPPPWSVHSLPLMGRTGFERACTFAGAGVKRPIRTSTPF